MPVTRPHPWRGQPPARPLVVGVTVDQSPAVVAHAADLARGLRTGLVCVWADPAHVAVTTDDAGDLVSAPVDPDQVDDVDVPAAETALLALLDTRLRGAGVPWRLVVRPGEVAHALATVADAVDAPLVVVGTRRPGWSGWMNELVGGSVAGRLAHTQARPVVLVPAPRVHDGDDETAGSAS